MDKGFKKYIKYFLLITLFALPIMIVTNLLTISKEVRTGNSMIMDDSGSTEYTIGWPIEYAVFRTFKVIGTPKTATFIDWGDFATDLGVFYIIGTTIYLISREVINRKEKRP